MKRPLSLRARLLWASVSVLLAFVVLTGAVLDRAFRESADAAQRERLEALLYLLMGTMELSPAGEPAVPAQLPESRLAVPGSGLYAAVTRIDRPARWQSDSSLGRAIPFDDDLAPAQRRNGIRTAEDGTAYRVVSQGVRWAIGETPAVLSVSVAAPLAAQGAEVRAYRQNLWSALAVMSALLLAALIGVQRWGLRPLRKLARRLAAMESGETRELTGDYPAEIAPVVANLNRLLAREHGHLERYRAALGDLAHSLKTPLAVLRGVSASNAQPALIDEQLQRMDQIVSYHLQRAATAGASRTAPAVMIAPLVERLFATMGKVYADRHIQFAHDVPAELTARIDEGDALELLGNLIDNASKWAAARVSVHAQRQQGGLTLAVVDDGPGMKDPARLLARGQRGDERVPGHGLGLAIVQDIALAYRGEVRIEHADERGTKVAVWLAEA